MSVNPRRQAARLLENILQDRASLADLDSIPADDSSPLLQELSYGLCRHYHELCAVAQQLIPKPLKDKDRDIHCLILLGLYQLLFLRIPDHAAINETVRLVRKPWARGLVNGVLREAQRQLLPYDPAMHTRPEDRYSHPAWLVEAILADWGEAGEAVLAANQQRAPMTLRTNLSTTSRDQLIAMLTNAGVTSHAGELAETAVILDKPCEVTALPGFREGRFSVQDEASQVVAKLLPLAPALKVLDACAAPGGKTCALLEREPELRLRAVDNHPKRLEKIRDNLQRMGLAAELLCADLSQPGDWLTPGEYDRILLDVPCSATGVIRRHPDIKLLRKPGDIERLCRLQADILRLAWTALKPGGYLLYSTCSVLKRENAEQIRAFLQQTPDAREQEIHLGRGLPGEPGWQLLPGQGNQDGFYYALLQKCTIHTG